MPRKLRPQAREALLNALRNGEDLSQGIVSSVVKKVAETEPPPDNRSELEKFRANPRDQYELMRTLRDVINDTTLTDKFIDMKVPNEIFLDVISNDAKRAMEGENSLGMDTRGIKMEALDSLGGDQRKILDYVRSVIPKREGY